MNQCQNCFQMINSTGECPYCKWIPPKEIPSHILVPGTILDGHYLVGRYINQGGFGITYTGWNQRLEKKVAIKEYFPSGIASRNNRNSNVIYQNTGYRNDSFNHERERERERFCKEAKILTNFDEISGVVKVLDCFDQNNTSYIVMQYLDGVDLLELIQYKRYTPNDIVLLLQPIMDGLDTIHRRGVIHRDISPDNIKILSDGSAKLMDFGAFTLLDNDATQSPTAIMKPAYSPLEQFTNPEKVTPAADIYSLCATIYHCITGQVPPSAINRLSGEKIQMPSQLGFKISERFEMALAKGLELKAKDRFQSINELTAAFKGENENQKFVQVNKDITNLLELGYKMLRDHDWDNADDYFNKALCKNPECAEGYFGRLLAREKCTDIWGWVSAQEQKYETVKAETLKENLDLQKDIKDLINRYSAQDWLNPIRINTLSTYHIPTEYRSTVRGRIGQIEKQNKELQELGLLQHTLQYADGTFKEKIDSGLKEIDAVLQKRLTEAKNTEKANRDQITNRYREYLEEVEENLKDWKKQKYDAACKKFKDAKTRNDFQNAEKEFEKLLGYGNSRDYIQKCKEKVNALEYRPSTASYHSEQNLWTHFKNFFDRQSTLIKILIIVISITVIFTVAKILIILVELIWEIIQILNWFAQFIPGHT